MASKVISLIRLAEQHLAQYNPQLSIQTLGEATKLEPGNYLIYQVLAGAYYEKYRQTLNKMNLRIASDNAKEALRLNPKAAPSKYLLGVIFIAHGENRIANDYLLEAIELQPNNAEYYVTLGSMITGRKYSKKGKSYFLKALELNPQSVRALVKLGDLELIRFGNLIEAEDYARKALTINNNSIEALVLMGNIMFRRKKYDEAKLLAKQAIARNPKDYNTLKLIYLIECRTNIFNVFLVFLDKKFSFARSAKNKAIFLVLLFSLAALVDNMFKGDLGVRIVFVALYFLLLIGHYMRNRVHKIITTKYLNDINFNQKF